MKSSDDSTAINLQNVSKIYRGRVYALNDISLSINRGEVFGLLGPNGAGKSTLIKIMMTVVRPTHAHGTILGRPVGHKPTLAKVGYLPENHRFPRYLTGRQTLEFFAALAGVDRSTRRRRAGELLELVSMSSWADQKVGSYSKGMMQRVGLAQALVNDPELVLLDEPTDGVDPVGRLDIRNVLLRLRDQGKTVFINSHLLSELEMICGRVAILVAGRVARHGRIHDLTAAGQRYEIEFSHPAGHGDSTILALREYLTDGNLGRLPSGIPLEIHGQTVRLATTEPADIQPLLDTARRNGLVIRRIQAVRPSLEELFMEAVAEPDPTKLGNAR
jgi:ABC-2 type transport system ATP-binding protein